MFGMSPLITALVVALAAFLASGWWFGVHRRRKAETAAGIVALANMKWRECAGLVLQALGEKGYREAPSSRQPGDGGTEFLMIKGDERALVSYKHGTAYRLGEANVRDFANGVQLQGATRGILVTLGTAEGFARDLAKRYDVDLVDGRNLWPQVEPFAPASMVEDVRAQAAGHIRRGQRMGVFGSIALGLVVFLGLTVAQQPAAPEPAVPAVAPAPAPAAEAPASPVVDTAPAADAPLAAAVETVPAAAAPAPETAAAPAATAPTAVDAQDAAGQVLALEEVAKLTDAQRTERRALAATRVGQLDQANSASWMSQSTLVISMKSADGIDQGLVNDACAILVQYEELRYSRLQLEPPPSDAATTPVRWRQCQ